MSSCRAMAQVVETFGQIFIVFFVPAGCRSSNSTIQCAKLQANSSPTTTSIYYADWLSQIQWLTLLMFISFYFIPLRFGSLSKVLCIWKPFCRQPRHIDANGSPEADEWQSKMVSSDVWAQQKHNKQSELFLCYWNHIKISL